MTDPVLIVGTGALATLFAARLSSSGLQVGMLGTWQAGLQDLRRGGATLVQLDGSQQSFPVTVFETAPNWKVVHAIVLVKSWQTNRVARQLAAMLQPDGLALTLQNGLGNREILTGALTADRVSQGVTTIGGTLLAPGLVRLGGEGALSLEIHPRLDPLVSMLTQAGFQVNQFDQIKPLVWGKLVVNSAINPLTAILRLPNGALLDHPARRSLMGDVARETASLASALSINLPFDDPAQAAENVARRTSSNHSSMLQDVLRGAPTEIESISGAIHLLGQKHAVATPYNACLHRLVRAITPANIQ